MKNYRLTKILLFSYCVAIGNCYAKSNGSKEPIICNQPYAVCTTAKCQILASDPTKAICSCEIEKGVSLGMTSCEQRLPKNLRLVNGQLMVKKNAYSGQLVSTYSFIRAVPSKAGLISSIENKGKESGNLKFKVCQGNPWAWCLDRSCVVYPTDANADLGKERKASKQAFCLCDMEYKHTEKWVIEVDANKCDNKDSCDGVLSAAPLDGSVFPVFFQLRDFLQSNPDLDVNQKYATQFCPADIKYQEMAE